MCGLRWLIGEMQVRSKDTRGDMEISRGGFLVDRFTCRDVSKVVRVRDMVGNTIKLFSFYYSFVPTRTALRDASRIET